MEHASYLVTAGGDRPETRSETMKGGGVTKQASSFTYIVPSTYPGMKYVVTIG